jgi:tRNA pseudouridine38-40 synthase
MVRGLVGAVIMVGEGKRDKQWLSDYLDGKVRLPEIFAAPALGLTFESVEYPEPEAYAQRITETLQVRPTDGTH